MPRSSPSSRRGAKPSPNPSSPTVYTRVDPIRHCQNLSPPKSPILVDFEMKRGFRGQAIYLIQSPPKLGDLGGISPLKRSHEDLCVHCSPSSQAEGAKILVPSPFERGLGRVNGAMTDFIEFTILS